MDEASSGFVLNHFDILTVCSSFYRDFLKLTKEESYQNGSRYRAIMSLFLVVFLTKLEPVYYVTHTAF